jgi:alpha-beta hydrolase superfamily lysophospholipase
MMSMRYTVVYEKARTGWGAYAPDLPGCGATGRTLPSSGSESDGPLKRMCRACEKMDCLFRGRVRLSDVVETGDPA